MTDSKNASQGHKPKARTDHPRASTEYSRARYAHPFFLSASHEARQPINGHARMTDWSKKQLGPVPPVKGQGVMSLSDVIGNDGEV